MSLRFDRLPLFDEKMERMERQRETERDFHWEILKIVVEGQNFEKLRFQIRICIFVKK